MADRQQTVLRQHI